MRTLSSLDILRLARENKLSLPLRHEWRKKTGWDPVNQERWRVHAKASTAVVVASFGVLVGTLIAEGAIVARSQIENLRLAVPILTAVCSVMVLVGIAWKGFVRGWLETGSVSMLDKSIRKHLSLFFYWTNSGPENTYLHELAELKEMAENVLRDIIRRQFSHLIDAPDPNGFEYRAWARANAELAGDFVEKYGVLRDLGLVTESEETWYTRVRQERTAPFGAGEEDSKVAADTEALETAGA